MGFQDSQGDPMDPVLIVLGVVFAILCHELRQAL